MSLLNRTLSTIALVLAVVLTPLHASADVPSTPSIQKQIDRVITQHGGQQTGWNEVSWDHGAITLTVNSETSLSPFAANGTTCAAGKYCVYSRSQQGGTKLSYSTCPATYTSFSALSGSVRSVVNNRSNGVVRAYSGNEVKAQLSAGQAANNVTGITKLTCN